MKMCMPHWERLRTAIQERGIWHLVSRNGEEAKQRLEKSLESGKIESFDPLISAHNMIVSNAVRSGGMYLMGEKPDGSEYCPLCELDLHLTEMGEGSEEWIEAASDGVLALCREKGLTSVQ